MTILRWLYLVAKPRKKKVYTTTTVETTLFFFFWVWGSMVYTLLSGPMVYTLFPCFPRKRVYTIAFFALRPWGRVTDREKRGSTVVVYTLFSPENHPLAILDKSCVLSLSVALCVLRPILLRPVSLRPSPGKGMDQWRSKFSESFSLDRHWSIECSSLLWHGHVADILILSVWWRRKGSRARKPWSANREPRGWQKKGCGDRCQERPEEGA